MSTRPRILVVDDEEAILETMSFTFEDDYEVLTSSSARDALALLEREGPVAVVISDQRMPEMTGVEFLARVFALHPTTVRIILTGFADMDAIMIRLVEDELKHELWGYRKFCKFRDGAEQRPWSSIAKGRLPGRLKERRDQIRTGIREREERESAA